MEMFNKIFDLCEFKSEGGDCESCGNNPKDQSLYFKPDRGYDSREGSYFCLACANKYVKDLEEIDDTFR